MNVLEQTKIFLFNCLFHRPFRRDLKIWRIPDVDNKFEAFLLLVLIVLALLYSQVAGGVDGDMGKFEKAIDLLQTIPAVLGFILSVIRHWYNWRLSKKRLAQAEMDDYLYALSSHSTSTINGSDATTGREERSSQTASLAQKPIRKIVVLFLAKLKNLTKQLHTRLHRECLKVMGGVPVVDTQVKHSYNLCLCACAHGCECVRVCALACALRSYRKGELIKSQVLACLGSSFDHRNSSSRL